MIYILLWFDANKFTMTTLDYNYQNLFSFCFVIKFVNPAEFKKPMAAIHIRKQQNKHSGSCSKMTSSCNCTTVKALLATTLLSDQL